MNLIFYTFLFVLWTMFWSFSSVIIYRIKLNEPWILNWRSHCAKCSKTLKFLDLFPIFSWLFNKWKCRYCKEKISSIYPILEITTWLLFSMVWYFLIDFQAILWWDLLEISRLFFYLIITFFSVIYIFYDILFLEIPEIILFLWIWITTIVLALQTIFPEFLIIQNLHSWVNDFSVWIYSIIISIAIISLLYVVMLKWLHEILDIIILSLVILSLWWFKEFFDINLTDFTVFDWIIWALAIFLFFFLQILISKWEWLWWWDLRIAILIWLILWTNLIFAWAMLSYVSWSIIWIIMLIYSKLKNKSFKYKMNTQIPFWPFLAIWFFLSIFYSQSILFIIEKYFNNM